MNRGSTASSVRPEPHLRHQGGRQRRSDFSASEPAGDTPCRPARPRPSQASPTPRGRPGLHPAQPGQQRRQYQDTFTRIGLQQSSTASTRTSTPSDGADLLTRGGPVGAPAEHGEGPTARTAAAASSYLARCGASSCIRVERVHRARERRAAEEDRDGLSRSGSAAPAMPASTARRASRGASAVMVPMTARPARPSGTATCMKLGGPVPLSPVRHGVEREVRKHAEGEGGHRATRRRRRSRAPDKHVIGHQHAS